METKKRRRAELDELAAGLKRAAASTSSGADPDGADEQPDARNVGARDYRAILHDLERTLTEAAEETEHIVVSHPLAAVAAAFLLGFMIGRMGGRS